MRTRFSRVPGASFVSIGLQTGPTQGIEIDNPSGSWLYIPTLETYIPPYTDGWAETFPYDVTSLDVVSGQAPAGQVSTTQGDNVTVWLTSGDDMRPPSAGGATNGHEIIPTNQNNPATIFNATPLILPTNPSQTAVALAAVANKRYRVFLAGLTVPTPEFGAGTPSDSPAFIWLVNSTANTIPVVVLGVSGGAPIDRIVSDRGIDFEKGAGITMRTFSLWALIELQLTIHYVLI